MDQTRWTHTYQTRWNDDGNSAEHGSAAAALAHARALDTAVRIYGPDGELWLRVEARIDDGRREGHVTLAPEPNTLAAWLQAVGTIARVYGAARVVAAGGIDAVTLGELWQLRDYRVTSVNAGSIWLMPKGRI